MSTLSCAPPHSVMVAEMTSSVSTLFRKSRISWRDLAARAALRGTVTGPVTPPCLRSLWFSCYLMDESIILDTTH